CHASPCEERRLRFATLTFATFSQLRGLAHALAASQEACAPGGNLVEKCALHSTKPSLLSTENSPSVPIAGRRFGEDRGASGPDPQLRVRKLCVAIGFIDKTSSR